MPFECPTGTHSKYLQMKFLSLIPLPWNAPSTSCVGEWHCRSSCCPSQILRADSNRSCPPSHDCSRDLNSVLFSWPPFDCLSSGFHPFLPALALQPLNWILSLCFFISSIQSTVLTRTFLKTKAEHVTPLLKTFNDFLSLWKRHPSFLHMESRAFIVGLSHASSVSPFPAPPPVA